MSKPSKLILAKGVVFLLSFVGVVGLSFPETTEQFKQTTPFFLITATLILFMFHQQWNVRFVVSILLIALAGFLLEVAGVQTGKIFGHYRYGEALGIKLFDTPLLIGMNWLMLLYCAYIVTSKLQIAGILRALAGAGILLVYDIILEPIATALDMWSWSGSQVIPLKNYIVWFVFSFIVLILLNTLKIPSKNRIAGFILSLQMIFFLLLHFTLI